MKLNTECNNLISGYVDEVCLNLPKKLRAEIATEIHSSIMDNLEDRTPDLEPDETMVIEVLKELGSPVMVANSYHPHNYVIGPKMYVPFWMTLRWSLIIMLIIYLFGFVLSWGEAIQSVNTLGSTLWVLISGFWNSTLQIFALIFIIFIILDRVIPEQDWVSQLKAWGAISKIPFLRGIFGHTISGEWDPSSLIDSPKINRVKRGETIFEIVVIILAAILFNFYPHKVGAFGILNGDPWFIPLLTPTFNQYLLWWNFYWLLTLGLNFSLLSTIRWTRTARWMEIGLLAFSWIIVYWMVTGSSILGLTPEYLALNNTSNDAILLTKETLLPMLSKLLQIFLVLHLIVKGIKGVIKLIRLLGRPPVLTFKLGKSQEGK